MTMTISDSELKSRGFMMLVRTFGDVNAERFIALVNREPRDYTKWREGNMYVGESVRETAARARTAAARLASLDASQPVASVRRDMV